MCLIMLAHLKGINVNIFYTPFNSLSLVIDRENNKSGKNVAKLG